MPTSHSNDRLRPPAAVAHDGHRPLRITLEGDEWFESAKHEWTELVESSGADRLFLGWDWQYRWWAHFGALLKARAAILLLRDETGLLVGIAPFFVRWSSARGLWRVRQMAPIGNVWRSSGGEVSEHLDWIARTGYEAHVRQAMGDYLVHTDEWDEILFSYAGTTSLSIDALHAVAGGTGCYVRSETPLEHYSVNTALSFDEFLASLGKHTRHRVYARRKLLSRLGAVKLVYADESNLTAQLDKLDHLSFIRWGTGLSPSMRGFYEDLSLALLRSGTLRFTTLEVDGRPISALYDVDAQRSTYNIRSAIDTEFHKRLSPGLLHLGYAIEAACQQPGTDCYALLAGRGKHTDFKRDFAPVSGSFTSLQLLRRPHDKWLYRAYDRLVGA